MVMKKSFLFAAAALVAASCSKREMGYDQNGLEPVEVRFASSAVAVTPDSKVTIDGTSKFENSDVVGIFAVIDGKKIDEEGAFPNNQALQYKDKLYSVTNVEVDEPYTATFTAKDDNNKIYYQTGGVSYNYYAYYPTADAGIKSMNSSYAIEETSNAFARQTNLFKYDTESKTIQSREVAYPGPMMYAYYNTADNVSTGAPVNLAFKYANAKLSLTIEMAKNAGTVAEIASVELYATTGLYGGYTLDLKQADEDTPKVVTQGSSLQLDGSGSGLSANSYQFQNMVKTNDGGATSDSFVIGYLIPADAVSGAKIRITKTDGEVFTANLDQTPTGTNYLPSIEAGKEYKFKITITKTEVQFTGTIEEWVPVDNTGTEIPAE